LPGLSGRAYAGTTELYPCRADTTDRRRSYFICDFIGGWSWDDAPLWESARRLVEISRASDAMVFLEEDGARG
jgi:hypothetical protein